MKTLTRTLFQVVVAAILMFMGWAIGRAQTSAPSFELVVDAPRGETTVRCVRGCELAWVERGVRADVAPTATFTYRCTGPRCSSGRVGGWVNLPVRTVPLGGVPNRVR